MTEHRDYVEAVEAVAQAAADRIYHEEMAPLLTEAGLDPAAYRLVWDTASVPASGGEQAAPTCTRCGHPAHWHDWLDCNGNDCDCKRFWYTAAAASGTGTDGGEQP